VNDIVRKCVVKRKVVLVGGLELESDVERGDRGIR